MRGSLVLACVATVLLCRPAAAAELVVAGRASVVDGNTLTVEGTKARVRLYGIEAPDRGQTCVGADEKPYPCGNRAADYLTQLVGRNGSVACIQKSRDRRGRIVAECSRTDGRTMLNTGMVTAGWAVAQSPGRNDRYGQAAAEAKANRRGLWAGAFVLPADWRKGIRTPDQRGGAVDAAAQTASIAEPADKAPPSGCRIKGNINGAGRMYHLPGWPHYDEMTIDIAAGERWFCSEDEARAAGWRAPLR